MYSLIYSTSIKHPISLAQQAETIQALLEKAKHYRDQQDYKNAMQWYLKAAEEGNDEAMLNISFLYLEGRGVKQDYQQALQWWLKAANNGEADAMTNIGILYENGLGVKQDKQQAQRWYQKAKEAKQTQQ